jgi:hypothetical protein
VPKSQKLVSPIGGYITVKEAGRLVIECPLGSKILREGELRDASGLLEYRLDWPANPDPHSKVLLQGRHTYDFTIRFSQTPPEVS